MMLLTLSATLFFCVLAFLVSAGLSRLSRPHVLQHWPSAVCNSLCFPYHSQLHHLTKNTSNLQLYTCTFTKQFLWPHMAEDLLYCTLTKCMLYTSYIMNFGHLLTFSLPCISPLINSKKIYRVYRKNTHSALRVPIGHLHDDVIWLQLPECFERSYCIQHFCCMISQEERLLPWVLFCEWHVIIKRFCISVYRYKDC